VREEEERRRRAAAAAAAQTSGGSVTSGQMVNGWTWPAAGTLRSGYGMRLHPIYNYMRMHNGQDVSNGAGTPIYAASSGRVIYSGYSAGFGNYVKIDHGGGISSIYAHILSGGLRVAYGQQVGAGQLVGLMGSTGPSTGNHLHLEVRRDNVPIDPLAYIRARGVPVG
jgi:murein DD-endopeptidase MepM/ murein hydrolase activator NlpD